MWVAPFGNLRVNGYLLLTAAYRSLSRPSSAPDAKAFPLRSFQLDLLVANFACRIPRLKSEDFWQNENKKRSFQQVFTEIAILMNYAGFTKKFFEIVIVTLHPFGCCSTIKTYASHSLSACLSVALLHFHHIVQFSRCSAPAPFEARSQNPILLGF